MIQITKKNIFIFSIFVVVLVVVAIVFSFVSQENRFGKRIIIENFSSKIKNISSDSRYKLESILYETVKYNGNNPDKTSGVVIREGSEKQSFENENKLYTGTFIIDIQSIKQSYRVNYRETQLADKTIEGGYALTIVCLDSKDLIFGDFKCKDIYSVDKIDRDPILDRLPYETLNYSINPVYKDDVLVLIVNISLSESEYRSGVEGVVSKYKNEVYQWIKSIGLNPENYQYQYNY